MAMFVTRAFLLAAVLALPLLGLTQCQRSPAQSEAEPRALSPPIAERRPHETTVHGERRVDPYHWLRDKEDPRVRAYLRAENDYADAVLEHTLDLQDTLVDEFLERIDLEDTDVPVEWGEYWYYTRFVEEEDYPIHARRRGGMEGPEEIVLNENHLAAGHNFFELGALAMSHDQQHVAFAVDTNGAERYTLRVKNLRTGKISHEAIPNVATSLAWGGDHRTIFYATLDEANRPYRVYRHTIGEEPQQDTLIHEERDEACYVYPETTKDRQFVLLRIERHNRPAEIRYVDASTPHEPFRVIHPREPKLEYSVEHHGDRFLILTNDQAPNYRLMEAPTATPGKSHWKEVLPHRPEVKLESIEVFAGHVALLERHGGLPRVEVLDLASGERWPIAFPEPGYLIEFGLNIVFDSSKLRLVYSSLLTPEQTWDYDLKTRTRELKKQEKVLGDFDASRYRQERITARAADGAEIPITLVYKKGLRRNGANPCLLYGYGSYGLCEDPYFDVTLFSLLDRGFVYAVAHVRGGGECGREWYENGKLSKKTNTFTDFIACAERLFSDKITSPKKLAISGASAGGLLVGAVVNQRPDLCHVAIADVPFVDVLNTMLDPTLPLTVTEYDEWGDPNQREAFVCIKAYAPYENVKAQAYPHLLVRAGLNDTRVAYWEPAKWVAALRSTKTDKNRLVLRTNLDAGHAGASGRSGSLEELAYDYAFLIDLLCEQEEG